MQKVTLASYQVVWRVARKKAAHTIAEDLLKPVMLKLLDALDEKGATKKLLTVPLSNDTIRRWITEMSANIKNQSRRQNQGDRIQLAAGLDHGHQ